MRSHFLSRLVLSASFYAYASIGSTAYEFSQQSHIDRPPPLISLSNAELNSLYQRRPVLKQYKQGGSTQQVIVFRISASLQNIWKTITDFESYPKWITGVEETRIYKQSQNNYYVDFVIDHWLLGTYRYSVQHYRSGDGWMKWQLDNNRPSDFAWSRGFWKTIAASNEPGTYDVYYSADLQFKQPKPAWMRKKIIKAGLKQASLWVQREAEYLTQR